ncbi:hypothetical protein DE10444_0790 [Neisseria meningitidis]|nr:hypothetical protein DE10444_0790 [Neisseria meningitidis]
MAHFYASNFVNRLFLQRSHYMCKPSRKCEIPSENLSDGICCLYCRFSSVSGFLFGAEADWQSDCNQRMKASRQKQSYPLHRPDI